MGLIQHLNIALVMVLMELVVEVVITEDYLIQIMKMQVFRGGGGSSYWGGSGVSYIGDIGGTHNTNSQQSYSSLVSFNINANIGIGAPSIDTSTNIDGGNGLIVLEYTPTKPSPPIASATSGGGLVLTDPLEYHSPLLALGKGFTGGNYYYESNLDGTPINYAGGGGGSDPDNVPGIGGAGGAGGGGAGAGQQGAGVNGTANTGGGGGGASNAVGGNGGSGVVILSMLDADYSGTTTGSPTESDDGTTKVLIFNGDGSYTA